MFPVCQALGYLPIPDLTQLRIKWERRRMKPRVKHPSVCISMIREICRMNTARTLGQASIQAETCRIKTNPPREEDKGSGVPGRENRIRKIPEVGSF